MLEIFALLSVYCRGSECLPIRHLGTSLFSPAGVEASRVPWLVCDTPLKKNGGDVMFIEDLECGTALIICFMSLHVSKILSPEIALASQFLFLTQFLITVCKNSINPGTVKLALSTYVGFKDKILYKHLEFLELPVFRYIWILSYYLLCKYKHLKSNTH